MKKFFITTIILAGTAVSAQVPDYNPNRDPIRTNDNVEQSRKPQFKRVGLNSHSLKNKAIMYLDGEEISQEEFSKINPETIESVTVLKDKSATAIYGEKGKNGVIIINLKRKPESDSLISK